MPSYKLNPRNVNSDPVQVVLAKNQRKKNIERKNLINQATEATPSPNTMTTTRDPTSLGPRRKTTTTTDINLLGVGTTINTSIGMTPRRSVPGSAQSGRVRSATNRARGARRRRGTVPKNVRAKGTRGHTTGTARSATGLTTGRAETTTSTIGMSGLGTTTGVDHAAAVTPAIAGEHQVTHAAGCTFIYLVKLCVRLRENVIFC